MRLSRATAVVALTMYAAPAFGQAKMSLKPAAGQQFQSVITVSDMTYGGPNPGGPGFSYSGSPIIGQNDARYQTPSGTGYDGVVRLLMKNAVGTVISGCTGSLMADGWHVLTAAHCVSSGNGNLTAASIDVGFQNGGTGAVTTMNATNFYAMPGYSGSVVDSRDLAIISLGAAAPAFADRYSIFMGNPLNQETIFSGYGLSGNGLSGAVINTLFKATPVRRKAKNAFDYGCDDSFFCSVGSKPTESILISDFDGVSPAGTYPINGGAYAARTFNEDNNSCRDWNVSPLTPAVDYNAYGLTAAEISALCDPYFGIDEGTIGSGDSGGPAFIMVGGKLQLAAVASFGTVRCIPSQFGQTSAGCPTGFIRNGSYFGSESGHVWTGAAANLAFISAVPEPSTYLLFGTGLLAIGVIRRRRLS